MAAKLGRLTARFRSEAGFGLVELMIALIVLAVGILATIGVFQTSLLHLGRATKVSTAAAVGEQQMENFRAVKFDAIGLEPTAFATAVTDSTFTGDTACKSTCTVAGSANGQTVTLAGGFLPKKTVTGADGKQYRADTYIMWRTITNGRPVKDITVVIRDPSNPAKTWTRVISSFDQSTGQ